MAGGTFDTPVDDSDVGTGRDDVGSIDSGFISSVDGTDVSPIATL